MGLYSLSSPNLFISNRSHMSTVHVHATNDLHAGKTVTANWHYVATVGEGLLWNELEVFGVIIRGQKLKDLAARLSFTALMVNREGYCYIWSNDLKNTIYGTEGYRLNDLFGWSEFGVVPLSRSLTAVCWNRRNMCDDEESVIVEAQQNSFGKELLLVEKLLEEKDEKLKDYELRLLEKKRELCVREREIQEKDAELKRMEKRLVGEGKRSNALKAAVTSLVNSLWLLNASLQTEVHADHLLPTTSSSSGVDVSSLNDNTARGRILSQMSAKFLEIIEQQSSNQE